MRAVDRGLAPKIYAHHNDARHDLSGRIGYYCSYCEMGVNNMIEVEHVHPVANGGNATDWDNFLLSCKYCNTVKSNNNGNRVGYFWPDIDNTDLLFDYTLDNRVLLVKTTHSAPHQAQANNLIQLCGLNRYPGSGNEPTQADTRWRLRDQVMVQAMNSYNNWVKVKLQIPLARPMMANQIAQTSIIGFYSVWCSIFSGEPIVLDEIDKLWKSTYCNFKDFQPNSTVRVIRPGGQI